MSSAVVQSMGQTSVENYRYNGNGIRIAKNTDGIETRYLIDPNGALHYVLAEYDADGNLSAYYTRGTELISRETSGEIRYYQYDPNGSVRLLTDASGDISDTYTYDAFGSLIYQTGTSGNSFLFQGEQYDAATGLYYLRARYMNPATGTFTSMDAYQGSTSDPMSLHKYLFANANPVMNSDPSGYFTLLETELTICLVSEISASIATEIFANDYFSQHGYGKAEAFDYGEYLGGAGLTFLRSFAHGLVAMVCVAAISIFALTMLEMVMCSIILAIVGLITGDEANRLDMLGNPEVAEALRIISQLSYTGSATFALEAIFAWLFGPTSSGSGGSKGSDINIKYGSDTKSIQKLFSQMEKRGWTKYSIENTVRYPHTTRVSTNMASGNSSTVFYNEWGGYVIIDDVTKEIVQVSDNINPSTWIPDPNIVDPYKP